MINLDRYLIPKEVIIGDDLQVLESYIDACESYLCTVAMESMGSSNDQFTNMSARARAAGKKMIQGQKTNNPSLVDQGNRELTSVTNELAAENKKAKSGSIKRKIITVAKVIIGVLGMVFIAFGAVKAGKAIKGFFSGKGGSHSPAPQKPTSTPTRNSSTVSNSSSTQAPSIQPVAAQGGLSDAERRDLNAKVDKLNAELKKNPDSTILDSNGKPVTDLRSQKVDFGKSMAAVLHEDAKRSREQLNQTLNEANAAHKKMLDSITERHAACKEILKESLDIIKQNAESADESHRRLADMTRELDEMDGKSSHQITVSNGSQTKSMSFDDYMTGKGGDFHMVIG